MDTFTQSTRIYARKHLNILRGLQLIKHTRLNSGPKSQLFLTKLKKQALLLSKSWQKKDEVTIAESVILPAC
jgi:hypothetical protein